jgi:hypothetical protein
LAILVFKPPLNSYCDDYGSFSIDVVVKEELSASPFILILMDLIQLVIEIMAFNQAAEFLNCYFL